MRLASIFLFLALISGFAVAADEADNANAAYAKGDYTRAIALYEHALSGGKEAPELYYNLGNAYFKDGKTGMAILNYERALRLAPHDEDILTNLQFAIQKTEDKIEPAPEMFLVQWRNSLFGLMTEVAWSVTCILLLVLTLTLFAIYLVSSRTGLRKFSFYTSLILAVFFIASFFVARGKATSDNKHDQAIIISPTVTVTGSPSDKGTKLFILHEGTKVGIEDQENGWAEIRLTNGNTGWISDSQLAVI